MMIDAHQHFWNPARGDYDWMPKDNETLFRTYGPSDLAETLKVHGIDGTVLVQAAATVCETEYMLGLADSCKWVKGVVGWVDFENPSDLAHLKRLAAHPKFLGVRPMIQDIPDLNWMLRDDVQWGFRAVCDLGLTFDALGFPTHIENFLTIVKRYPDMPVVYDHCMKPQIRDQRAGKEPYSQWAEGMARLAGETAGYCKFSGLVTEANANWQEQDLEPFAKHVIGVFGAERTMWGSDWPVCTLQAGYADWFEVANNLTGHLSAREKAEVFGGSAARFYGLS